MTDGGPRKKATKKKGGENPPTMPKSSIENKGRTRLKIHRESDPAVDPFFNEMQDIVARGFTQNMEVDNPEERPVLPFNTKITTMVNSYVIIKKLGAGGFGDVYEVHRERDKGVLAMKTEFDVEDDMLQRLKREVLVYEVINAAKRENPRLTDHILHMVDKGYNQYFKYIIMPYTGKSLDYIKETIVKGEFQLRTAVQISIQTHKALKNLHELGYIHRDVKPDNFVVGNFVNRFREKCAQRVRSLYNVLSLVEPICSQTAARQESRYKFIGTPKYAARATHQGRVVNRKEDMESWYYMKSISDGCLGLRERLEHSFLEVIELFGTDYLPWANEEDLDKMFYMKDCFFSHKYDDTVFHERAVPKDLIKIMREIDRVDGANRPNYEEHEKVLEKLIADFKIDFYAPFEWADALAKYYFLKEQKEEELKNHRIRRTRKSKPGAHRS